MGLSAVRFWIVSAWWPEQREMAEKISGAQGLQIFSPQISISGSLGFLRTGVGTPRAAAAVSNALSLGKAHGSRPEAVLFMATAGAYSNQFALGSAHYVSSVVWTDGDLLLEKSYLPGLSPGVERLNSELQPFTMGNCTAISTPGITLDSSLSRELSHHGAFENLELYGVALAAQTAGIPWGSVLGVSNFVGPEAHSEWKENHLAASRNAQEFLFESYLRSYL